MYTFRSVIAPGGVPVKRSAICRLAFAAAVVCAAPLSAQSSLAATPSNAVEEFIRAAADSNLTRMSQLWGTSKGSAAKTSQPKDYGKRMIIMQAYLYGVDVRTLGEVPAAKSGRRLVTTELSRGACKVTLPFTTVRADGGWIVNEFDLAAAAEVNKPCEGSGRARNPVR